MPSGASLEPKGFSEPRSGRLLSAWLFYESEECTAEMYGQIIGKNIKLKICSINVLRNIILSHELISQIEKYVDKISLIKSSKH